ncbi:MAG: glycosyltransferase [Candidatus Moraniibacteriota bacterium]
MNKKELKVALVHDFLVDFGGAERVLAVLSEMFPDAPIYTLIYEKKNAPKWLLKKEVRTSFLQKWPSFLKKRKKWLLPILPVAPETFNLRDFDLVISSSGAWSKGIITRLDTMHIAYLHSPMRFVWDANNEYLHQQKKGGIINFFVGYIKNYIRIWDYTATERPDYLIANSLYTQERIRKYYKQEARVIYPPVSVIRNSETNTSKQEDYFLVVSRLSPYKKIDVIIEAFNKLELPLIIVGTGSQEKYLKSIANKNIKFLGFRPDNKLVEIYARARGFIFASTDDFGIAPVEAMAFGIPVLAVRKGGVREIVIEGKTGEFFDTTTPEVISDGVRRFQENEKNYDREFIRKRAAEFNKERFKKEMEAFIENSLCQSSDTKK